MAEKRIDDSKLDGISGGAEQIRYDPKEGVDITGSVTPPVPTPGGQNLPKKDTTGGGYDIPTK